MRATVGQALLNTLHFHFALGLANYVAGLDFGGKGSNNLQNSFSACPRALFKFPRVNWS